MLRSMTGYGRGKYQNESREYIVEIKSVNNRFSDISIKLPRSLSFLEDSIKKTITASIARGKIEVFITFINNSDRGKRIQVNKDLAKAYIDEMRALAESTLINSNIDVTDIIRLPDVLNTRLEDEVCLVNGMLQFFIN